MNKLQIVILERPTENGASFNCDERVDEIGSIAKNKDVFVVSIGNGWRPSTEEYWDIASRISRDVDIDVTSNPFAYGLTDGYTIGEINYVAIREQAFRIARYFKWSLKAGRLP